MNLEPGIRPRQRRTGAVGLRRSGYRNAGTINGTGHLTQSHDFELSSF